ncbi:murein biosynthesis integral membrane protein MurJ [Nocardioides sp. zg-579]|uniref:Murein biosynthesis integral membrane protein MurJ n=1 Tax=Nocardioides marmotae TaxID=2663857 RepID=A0A6I3JDW8_9ACTN|nr:murein biosynthesis integral membrane protein MurJ [Nocardioides marmotae]MCR6032644.1 murein biosynthesis integral membrane protein MurJ [Gordonia jinghuaiqii]MTB96292.1 murein biosynthesis integral membrane protein MurJ [Nocardioides marmotae]QKE03218.1 murein biosynthesis integral membrane protein MurJ [Nocardioides marmotae]
MTRTDRPQDRPQDPQDQQDQQPGRPQDPPRDEQRSILSSSAVMAAGTIVSRLSGYVRTLLLAAALGNLLHADVFNIANTIPNMLYILLAGGVFNAVLVPQLVRAASHDADRGEAYTNRVVTLAALFLGAVTVALVVAAPWVMNLYVDPGVPADARESVVDFARWCLPQVFFYGMFVLLGQILNSRGRFGPMMWAPIANNVISVAVLLLYLVLFGTASEAERSGGFTAEQELVLGLGSTLGIAAQLLVLLPYLRAAGFSYRPRFDFRGTGLGHTLRLGVWTVLFVIVNQIAYTVVVRLASGGTADGASDGTGYSVYSAAFLIIMVPHSVITVSLATAILPTLSRRAADQDLAGLARTLSSTLRTALVVVLPFAALLPVVAPELARVISLGAAAPTYANYIGTLAAFGPGLVLFTVHYLMLRGFYALEQTRTVFFIQCAVGVTNVLAALVLVHTTDAAATAPALAVAYAAAYLVGALLSYAVLRGRLGGLRTPVLVRFLVRAALAVAASTAAAWLTSGLLDVVGEESSYPVAVLRALVVVAVDIVVFVAAARALRLTEVTSVLETVTRRLPLPRGR